MPKRLSFRSDIPRKRRALVATAVIMAILVAGLARMAAAQPIGAEGQAVPAALPPGPGHDTVVRVCSACHSPDIVATQHLSAAEWRNLVDLMVRQGASASDQEQAEIANYLTRSFPPNPPISASRPSPSGS